jgi:general secretion pathway protein C
MILFMTMIAYFAVGIFYKVLSLSLSRTQAGVAAVETAAGKGPAAGEPVESYKVIMDRNLFGSTDKVFTEKQLAVNAPPPPPDITTLFDLRGTVAGDAKYGFAILEDKGKRKQGLYKVGDSLGGGKITKILRNSIVVKIGEEEKTLKIAETKEAPIVPPPGIVGQAPPMLPVAGPSGTITVNRSDLNEGLKDIGSMLSQAQVRPYFSMGAPDGFMVSNIRPGSIYQRLGITNGDIIQGVNDRPIKTADDMMQFYNTMKGASNLSLNIRRQGRQEKLNYVFQ